ncbi:hypothetical protein RBH29_16930 [Herbivorax sp. ANBcel31]|uniref:hypothetical protein n=1 Tax=Herbivorax sp. ANBcel31 TaxID=3069754 RepID=UPI0027B18FD8|nr:hypothetical protein [Herbivorax sp. ANBcel31]MDQ2088113.1 hypothetical protein [Herbivorax sp. ANBcel31]
MKTLKKKWVLLLVICIVLITTSVIQYSGRKKIKDEILSKVNHDTFEVVNLIADSYNVLKEIMETGVITKEQALILRNNSLDIHNYFHYISSVAYEMGKHSGNYKNVIDTSMSIHYYIYKFIEEDITGIILDDNNALIKLDKDKERDFRVIKELYWQWVCAVNLRISTVSKELFEKQFNERNYEEYYGENIIEGDKWVSIINYLTMGTEHYLSKFDPPMKLILDRKME